MVLIKSTAVDSDGLDLHSHSPLTTLTHPEQPAVQQALFMISVLYR